MVNVRRNNVELNNVHAGVVVPAGTVVVDCSVVTAAGVVIVTVVVGSGVVVQDASSAHLHFILSILGPLHTQLWSQPGNWVVQVPA